MNHTVILITLLLIIPKTLGAEAEARLEPASAAAGSLLLVPLPEDQVRAGDSSLPPTNADDARKDIPSLLTAPAAAPSSSSSSEKKSDGVDVDWLKIEHDPNDQDPTAIEIPPFVNAKLLEIWRRYPTATAENMPFEVFLIDRDLWSSIKIKSGYWMKYLGQTASRVYSCIAPYTFGFFIRSLSTPALDSYSNMVARGDVENFPEVLIKDFDDILAREKIEDREAFEKLPVCKRAISFQTFGFNGTGSGYDGFLIFVDFNFGVRVVTPGAEYGVISQYASENPLNHLVTTKRSILPRPFIAANFAIDDRRKFTKIGQVWKNSGLHTCLAYEASANPDSMLFTGMRIPKAEWFYTHKIWAQFLKNQEKAKAPSISSVVSIADDNAGK